MSTEKRFNVSWDEFHRDTRALSWSLSELNKNWDIVVTITRGGLVPAAIVSRELGLQVVESLSICSRRNYKEESELVILKDLSPEIKATKGQNILVIDDLADTGKTFRAVKEVLPLAHYATVYVKPEGRSLVDNYVTEVSQDTWIYFPWDIGLTYQAPINKNHKG